MSDNTKVFGMSANAGRWVFIILGMIVNLWFGAVYAYSVFKGPLKELFSEAGEHAFYGLYSDLRPLLWNRHTHFRFTGRQGFGGSFRRCLLRVLARHQPRPHKEEAYDL